MVKQKRQLDVSIITSAHQVSDARLHRIALALSAQGLRCEVIAPGRESDAPEGVIFTHAPFSRKFTGRVLRDVILPWRARGKVVIALAPDLLPMSRFSTFFKGQFFAVDLYEDYLDLLNDRSWAQGVAGKIGKAIARIAISIAEKADLTSVADEQVRPSNAHHRIVLKNLPSLEMLPSNYLSNHEGHWQVEKVQLLRNEKPTAIYIGDIRESRGLGWMLELAAKLPQWDFILIGNANPHDRERISHCPNIDYLGPMSPQESWKHAIGAWVGLSLLAPTPAFLKAIPSKLYEYAAVGLPIVSTNLPRPAQLITQGGNGHIINTPDEGVQLLTSVLNNPENLEQMARSGLEWIAAFMNSDSSYQQYFEAVKKGLNPSRL
jgi:glycosyltransferase involved in cell wall biosynthesis